VVVNFPVEHDRQVTVLREDRLITGIEVYDLEPRRAQRADTGLEHTLLVWSAMDQRGGGFLNSIGIRCPMFMGETNDATQATAPLLFVF
jgi:hypothetical protein